MIYDEAPLDFRAVSQRLSALIGKQLFFVGGAPKSGTSWFQRLLDVHPEISCGGESHFIDKLFPALMKVLEEQNQAVLEQSLNPLRHELGEPHPAFDFADLKLLTATAILTSLLKQVGGRSVRAIGERTTNNVHVFTGLLELFPHAKFLHIVRDPRDVSVSMWFHARRHAPEEMRDQIVPACNFVRQNVPNWVEAVRRGVGFGERNPDRYCDFRYEDLLDQPVPIFTRICRFLGVDDREAVVRQCLDATSFEKLSGGRKRGEESETSFFRKGVAGDWRRHIDEETSAYVIAWAGDLMRRFGYL